MEILVTGAAGYIGGMVVEKLADDPSVKKIIGIDRAARPAAFAQIHKLDWIAADLASDGWMREIPSHEAIDVVIHCAFIIRNPYGDAATKAVEEKNLTACKNVFRFALDRNVARLVYLSSVAAYGAKPSNIGRLLTESEPLSETVNPYGWQKAESERILEEAISKAPNTKTQTFVVRLNSVTGPRGQNMESKFGLITFLRKLLPFIIKADPHWARQYVHEEDVRDAIIELALHGAKNANGKIEAFNIAPAQFLTAKDMARLTHKVVLPLPAWSVKPLFAIAWHITHGKFPSRPDSAAGLIYPINVDGSRIEKMTSFRYKNTAEDAFLARK